MGKNNGKVKRNTSIRLIIPNVENSNLYKIQIIVLAKMGKASLAEIVMKNLRS